MYKRVLIITAVAVALGAAWMQAQKVDAAAVVAKTLSVTIAASSVPAASPSACANSGYSAICPSGTCQCVKITDATLTGGLGKGTATLLITEDPGAATAVQADANCFPFFATAALSGTIGSGKKAKTQIETVNIVGADCDPFTAKSSETLSGGFGVAAAPSPSPAITGWGSASGTVDTKGAFKFTLKGPFTP